MNTVHCDEENQPLSEQLQLPASDIENSEDAKSHTSSVSASKKKVSCPHCPKDITIQNMFRHIRNTHPQDFECYMTVWDVAKLEKMVSSCEPFPVEYTTTNDFDETVEHKFYGCLACNNTFTTVPRALGHCKNAKCRTKHLSELKLIIKAEVANKKAKKMRKPLKPVAVLASDLVLEMRRYKYILKLSTELNGILDKLIEKMPQASMEESKRFRSLTTFPQTEYTMSTTTDGEELAKRIRIWARRVDVAEQAFCVLRDYLYYFSYSSVDRFWPERDDRPFGEFVALNYHESAGPDTYPSIQTPDESLIAP